MRIRHTFLIKAAGLVGAGALNLWMRTLNFQYRATGPSLDPHRQDLPGRYIYALWHENLLLPVHLYSRPDICVLISRHADGQLIAEVCRHLRVRVVRGSTTRGGVEALRRLLQAGRRGHLALTPDGPRGPRRVVQPGLVYLAARIGLPIVPVAFGFERPWRLQSWDCFALPRPWSRATCITGAPIHVPPDTDKSRLEHYRRQVEGELAASTCAAEEWAETGTWTKPQLFIPATARNFPIASPAVA